MLTWHINNTDVTTRTGIRLTLNSELIPEDCKINQTEIMELIERCKSLIVQSQSIMQYKERDMKQVVEIMREKYKKEVETYARNNLNEDEYNAYKDLLKMDSSGSSLIYCSTPFRLMETIG